jgi:hypothetical protein
VPSKALLASAKVAHHMRTAGEFGITPVEPEIDTARVFARIREVQQRIAATDDSPERFRDELGIDLLEGTARLTGPTTLDVDGERIETRFVLLCTGSRPVVPPLEGLAEAGHLDSESVGSSSARPRRSSSSAAARSPWRWRRASSASASPSPCSRGPTACSAATSPSSWTARCASCARGRRPAHRRRGGERHGRGRA